MGATRSHGGGQRIKISSKSLVDSALREIETIAATDAITLVGREDVVLIDIRESVEREQEGAILGSLHVPRGVLEFYVDPESPVAQPVFAQDKRFVLYCAIGWRSALAAQTLQQMGLPRVAHIGGGLSAWKAAGGPLEAVERDGSPDALPLRSADDT